MEENNNIDEIFVPQVSFETADIKTNSESHSVDISSNNEIIAGVKSVPVADIIMSENKEKDKVFSTRQYSVVIPKEEIEDFIIEVRVSQLKEVRTILEKAKSKKSPNREILLGITSILVGAMLSSIISGVRTDSILGVIFYFIFGVFSSITGTSYFFIRKDEIKNINDLSEEVINRLPNPDNVTDKEK